MKRIIIIAAMAIVFSSMVSSQVFTELTTTNFRQIERGSVDWGDIDNDKDLDIILTGDFNLDNSFIYTNKGNNSFSESPLVGVPHIRSGTTKFAEFNGDGYLDIIVSEGVEGYSSLSTIFLNNKDGSFTMQYGTDFSDYGADDFDYGDLDNDGDLDLTHSGDIMINQGTIVFESRQLPDSENVSGQSSEMGDYDNDGDLDLLITGRGSFDAYTKIYENKGDYLFIPREDFNLQFVNFGRASWGDYNSDGFLDVLVTGANGAPSYIHVYENLEGVGFSLSFSKESYDFYNYSIWGDYNNDGWMDFIVASKEGAKVFKNVNGETFEEQTNESITDFERGELKFGDYDNDGDLDLLLNGDRKTKLYVNNTTSPNTAPSPPTSLKSTVDSNSVTLIWKRSQDDKTPKMGLSYNLQLIRGIDQRIIWTTSFGDGYQKIVRRGNANLDTFMVVRDLLPGEYRWRVQSIDNGFMGSALSTANYFFIGEDTPILDHTPKYPTIPKTTKSYNLQIANIGKGSISYSIDQDGDWFQLSHSTGEDNIQLTISCDENTGSYRKGKIIITPYLPEIDEYIIEFAQEGSNIFYPIDPSSFDGVSWSASAWGDYDNDGDLDLMLSGDDGYNKLTKLYTNHLEGGFEEDEVFNPIEVKSGFLEWNDYNNDGKLDIIISGDTDTGDEEINTRLYKNTGSGILMDAGIDLPGIYFGTSTFGDCNNDGWGDIMFCGISEDKSITELFINDGEFFTKDTLNQYRGKSHGGSKWFDYNKDGKLDFMRYGDNSYDNLSYLHKNLGNNEFDSMPFPWTRSHWFIDINENEDVDLFIGSDFYVFDEADGFKLMEPRSFPYVKYQAWGDYDNDGDLDIAYYSGLGGMFLLFENFGDNTFKQAKAVATDFDKSVNDIKFVDFNNDGKLDLFIAGFIDGDEAVRLYENNYYRSNQQPNPPTELTDSTYAEIVYLKWNRGSDKETSEKGLLYNFYLYGENGDTIVNCLSNKSTGFLKTISQGNANKNTNWHIVLPQRGTYTWSVQSIDYSYKGSPFATEKQFTITEFLAFTESMQGLFWKTGQIHSIHWDEAFLEKVKLEYSIDEGASWYLIADSIQAVNETFDWQLPLVEPARCLLKISDEFYSLSDTVTINIIPNIELITPDKETSFQTNREVSIGWISTHSEFAKLEYRLQDEFNWLTIENSVQSSDSQYSWEIPNVEPANYFIRITDTQYQPSRDSVLITILPYLKLTSPIENEVLIENAHHKIKWESAYVEKLNFVYYDINYSDRKYIISYDEDAYQDYFWWLIPINFNNSDFRIIASDVNSAAVDTSGVFTIITSVEEHLSKYGFAVYPNPSKNQINISFNNKYKNVLLHITDMQGSIVYESRINNQLSYHTNLSMLNEGTYILSLTIDGITYHRKLILME